MTDEKTTTSSVFEGVTGILLDDASHDRAMVKHWVVTRGLRELHERLQRMEERVGTLGDQVVFHKQRLDVRIEEHLALVERVKVIEAKHAKETSEAQVRVDTALANASSLREATVMRADMIRMQNALGLVCDALGMPAAPTKHDMARKGKSPTIANLQGRMRALSSQPRCTCDYEADSDELVERVEALEVAPNPPLQILDRIGSFEKRIAALEMQVVECMARNRPTEALAHYLEDRVIALEGQTEVHSQRLDVTIAAYKNYLAQAQRVKAPESNADPAPFRCECLECAINASERDLRTRVAQFAEWVDRAYVITEHGGIDTVRVPVKDKVLARLRELGLIEKEG